MGAAASLEQKIRALRDRFVLGLASRVAKIDEELARIAGDGSTAALERHFHTLAGTASTYGLEQIAAIASRGEEICCDQIVDDRATGELHALVAELGAAIGLEHGPESPRPTLKLVPPAEESADQPTRVLCVEDDPDQTAYLTTVLEDAGYETAWASDAASFESAFASFRPDLLILDINLPDASGIDLARSVRQSAACATLPIIFLTYDHTQHTQLDGLRAGGDDYLVKPVSAALLLTTLETRLERSRLMRSLIETDGLTGLLTHAAFQREIENAVAEHARGEGFSLVAIDIDRFKSINDTHGHATGDRALAALGSLLRNSVRRTDAVGRCGGDELALLLRRADANEARSLADHILQRCISMSRKVPVTFSGGVAALRDGEDAESWKQRADDAMYAAKHAGRARVMVAS
jgi:diguanylate cyclase (GGDEF)-like protein